uniref:Late embryogenesis abundant protein Lea5 n=1 Tax=Picea sitchensis TaxID=3332 RepID=B8LKT0_PICSI|nr:unknown [Picea sitchensis]ACN40639.1 unknown [Picea sitchensis]
MARSLLHLKVAAAGALSRFGGRGFDLGSNLGIQSMRGYSAVVLTAESRGLRPEPKQVVDKAAAGYKQRSWMPDPVTGYYIPEDHFGEADVAEQRENILRNHSTSSGRVPN